VFAGLLGYSHQSLSSSSNNNNKKVINILLLLSEWSSTEPGRLQRHKNVKTEC
jgi:hypothetical protein